MKNHDASGLSRSQFIRRTAALGVLASVGPLAGEAAASGSPRGGGLRHRGINYDVGTNYEAGYPDPVSLSTREYDVAGHMRRDIRVIDEQLNCNAISIHGTDVPLLIAAAELAVKRGLFVWVQPRLIDSSPSDRLAHMRFAARGAERLRNRHPGRVGFNVGVETSLFMDGIVPGDTYIDRLGPLFETFPVPAPIQQALNAHLVEACTVARSVFDGPLTYSAGPWEDVDWTPFDVVGLDVYAPLVDEAAYLEYLNGFHSYGKPVIATEFGTTTHEGAELAFGGDANIIDWSTNPPSLIGDPVRSEATQANDIERKLAVFKSASLDGAFVFTFMEPHYLHTENPLHDLDMASFGIVAPVLEDPDGGFGSPVDWVPKEAFHRIRRLYGAR